MKYNTATQLTNLDGTPLKNPDGSPVTFKVVAVACLIQSQGTEGSDKYEAFRLAVKLESAKGTVELEAEEVARLKRLIGASMPVVVVGRMFDLLDQK